MRELPTMMQKTSIAAQFSIFLIALLENIYVSVILSLLIFFTL